MDIYFIHVKSRHTNALPMIITHGWPGSVIELLDVIDPLTNPTAHGGKVADAFHLVVPSLPGYGFSGEPSELGWESGRIARAWAVLMERLDIYPKAPVANEELLITVLSPLDEHRWKRRIKI